MSFSGSFSHQGASHLIISSCQVKRYADIIKSETYQGAWTYDKQRPVFFVYTADSNGLNGLPYTHLISKKESSVALDAEDNCLFLEVEKCTAELLGDARHRKASLKMSKNFKLTSWSSA
jgi:hypothetical protein